MNKEVAQLNPVQIWENFEKMNEVPRGSKKEERIIAFTKKFGEDLGLETIVDKTGNVIIKKPATLGMEDRKGIILQSHIDMVHQKNADTDFNFDTDGIQSYIDGDWVKAKGTTLGADNGIGAATIMGVLASKDLVHGPIEGLFTIDEETGMTGAFGLEGGILNGDILLNLDTEDEHELCIGCAGGIDTNVNYTYDEVAAEGTAFHIQIKGLKGGHSGCEIHLGRGNANKLMNRLLWGTRQKFGLEIAQIDGGSLRNAIPRESFADVVIAPESVEEFKAYITAFEKEIKTELHATEPNLVVAISTIDTPAKVMDVTAQDALLSAIYAAPCGVIRMSDDLEGLVETSTSMARVKVGDGNVLVQSLTRSSVDSAKFDVTNQLDAAFAITKGNVEHGGAYPGWTPNATSQILEEMKEIHQDLFGKPAVVNAVHAGLECGIIGSHYPNLDMISFGPTIKNPHSPDEMCEIATVSRFWDYLKITLEKVAKK
ncbi:aminoacyl-histidine dipeptidase [Flammeovirga kamogawensis]|uniref:Aminoacyl-histidine dipeptidase n=1 Tax=Flammeovirga kamogawensis TaxID=373891 RepID=A0ABX8GX97_9BACT|nr:aminoacyl-histidine dipeptidase [Flammeovirga kamogawensis]MBB6460689.1 dipeptidase D [Flammeovirga kamogawensis]QWG08044.1 aminoacyl-histidine dipeptidase [Flammeovirga kamogawensis]TRX69851.1 aminoacyl-histidine dipeptidase [Flammeovirga kamogawensis]